MSPGAARRDGRLGRALVLNATYEPLCVVPVRRAVVLVLKQKAEVVHENGGALRSERLVIPVPSVIRLRYVVKVPLRARATLSRRAVFVRDHHTCQYCGAPAENVDHVVPRSRGGAHTWENVVAACRRCNSRKENRLPHEVGLRLRSVPRAPHDAVWVVVAVGQVDPTWRPYLAGGLPRTAEAPA
jgi:5-methylcytosine-specific restriction endonuclease McrA